MKRLFTRKKTEDKDKDEIKEEAKDDEEEPLKKEEEKKEEKPKEIVMMKKGDYNVHILVEEVKNLIQIKEGKIPVPRVKLNVFGKSQRTSKMKKPCTDFVFNEHFYFDKTNLTAEMLDSEKITIEVYDNNNTHKADYFGIYELDFGYVYNQEGHSLHNVWIGLANPESSDISKIRGYLKISVAVLHESDQRIELESKDNEISNCLIPTQIKMKYKQISFYFFRGEEFPDMDSVFSEKKVGRRCDGYIEVKYMGIVRKTKVVEMKNEMVEWNQIVDIPATMPAVSQKICFVVKDEDVGRDDIVGSFELKVDDIYNGHYNNLTYIDIYGSPINKRGGIYDQMNYNAEIGSRWNGRILMMCKVTDIDSPIASVRDIPKEENNLIETVKNTGRGNLWSIWIRVISVFFLPEKDREYAIKVSIQDNVTKTRSQNILDGKIDFDETLKLQFRTFGTDLLTLPDLYIYLVDVKQKPEKQNVCFQRIKVSAFHLNNDITVIKLLPDPCIGKVKTMMKSGILKCKICFYHSVNEINSIPKESDFLSGGRNFTKLQTMNNQLSSSYTYDESQSNLREYTIIVVVYMSKGLVAAESNGTSDPFITLTLDGKTLSTSVKNNTMNGVWNEKLEFEKVSMDFNDISTWPIFMLNVYDYNQIKSNVALGYNYVWLCNAGYTVNDTKLCMPKWHNLFLPKSNKKQGQILLSFYIFDVVNLEKKGNIEYIPETQLYNCEICVLGLRELKPLGLIAVKKPFIKFDLNSLNVTGRQEDSHAPVQTIPVNGGSNPTINTLIKFDVQLPTNDKFMPELQCEVYDHMLSGMHNSLLGVFSIDVKKIIKKTSDQINEDTKETKKISAEKPLKNMVLESINTMMSNPMYTGTGNNNIINTNDNTINTNSNIINTNDNIIKEKGMSEKYLEDSGNDLINTQKKKYINEEEKNADSDSEDEKNNLLKISRSINTNSKLLEDDEEEEMPLYRKDTTFLEESELNLPIKKSKIKEEKEKIKNMNMEMEVVIPMDNKNPNMKNIFRLSGKYLKENINDSKCFVVYPNLKYFKLPGYGLREEKDGAKVTKEFLIEDTSKIPDSNIYFKIRYLLKAKQDMDLNQSTKHYRRIYGCPLENVDVEQFKIKSPFNVGKIRRGKFIDQKSETSLFDALRDDNSKIIYKYTNDIIVNDDKSSVGSVKSQVGFMSENTDKKSYGKFKGLIRIASKTDMDEYNKAIEENKNQLMHGGRYVDMKNFDKYDKLCKRLVNKEQIIIRVYILELNELAKKDMFSESDPYIKLYLNDKLVINERKNYQEDQKNCKWYKYYDIAGEIPGSSNLKIEVWDWEAILSDDLIGYTTIDLEDRYFNEDWQNLIHKPVEVRPLINPDLSGPQGQVYMWLEMFKASEKSQHHVWKISPEPITELEVRFIVWETEDMEMMDAEGTSDIYVIGYLGQKDRQKTDVHFRCQTGNASFNWRMLLPLQVPIQKPELTIQVYDKDIFSSDDFISGTKINLKNLVMVPKHLEMPIKFTREYYQDLDEDEKKIYGDIEFLKKSEDEEGIKFWVQCYKGRDDATGEGEKGGRVMCSLEILPKALADIEKVGKGRDEPNINPHLPPPVGRFEWTLNPFKFLNQLVGPKFRRKCYCICLCCLAIIYLVYALPTILTKLVF
jgi:hypothetical protein